MNSVYALTLSTWFAFRQSASLDVSDIYVPHPWKRSWFAIFLSVLATPRLVDAILDARSGKRSSKHVLGYVLLLALPWLMAELDPNLRDKYNFENMLNDVQRRKRLEKAELRRKEGLPRTRSEVPLQQPGSPLAAKLRAR